MYKIRN